MPRAWDPADDAPAEELLRQAGLPDKTFELRVRTLFNALRAADGDGVGVSAFSALLIQLGVPAGACEHIHAGGPVCLDAPPPARAAAPVCHGVPESAPSPRDLSELPAPTDARRGLWRPAE